MTRTPKPSLTVEEQRENARRLKAAGRQALCKPWLRAAFPKQSPFECTSSGDRKVMIAKSPEIY